MLPRKHIHYKDAITDENENASAASFQMSANKDYHSVVQCHDNG